MLRHWLADAALLLYCASPCTLLCFSSCFALSRSHSFGGFACCWLRSSCLPLAVLFCCCWLRSSCLPLAVLFCLLLALLFLPAVGFALLGSFHGVFLADGETPNERRCNSPLDGPIIPFGAEVIFDPTSSEGPRSSASVRHNGPS